jgi:hypothetical protein
VDVESHYGHGLYLVFQHSPAADAPSCRVLGPYPVVRFAATGIWADGPLGEPPLRVATRGATDPCWELAGLDDPPWGDVAVFAPDRATSAREIESGGVWVRPV